LCASRDLCTQHYLREIRFQPEAFAEVLLTLLVLLLFLIYLVVVDTIRPALVRILTPLGPYRLSAAVCRHSPLVRGIVFLLRWCVATASTVTLYRASLHRL
jgi:hypothetical protein